MKGNLEVQLKLKDERIKQLEQELAREKSRFVEVNLNNSLLFEPTDKGLSILQERYPPLRGPKAVTMCGSWFRCQGWQAMSIFAPHFILGPKPPINMNIRLERKDLKSVDMAIEDD